MKKQNYRVVGVMSGTSLDGIDLCEVEFHLKNQNWSFRIVRAETVNYPKHWVNKLKKAHLLTQSDAKILDIDYTTYLSDVILGFINHAKKIDLVCSHGHTIWHQPHKGLTYQIGNLPELVKYVQHTVVCDFRIADVRLGGQGAPLVPIGDRLLFPEYDYCINIGGFVNISFENNNERTAFDLCPANTALNFYAEKAGFQYDKGGKIAAKGRFNDNLFKALNAMAFYLKKPPKSLGVEWLEAEFKPIVESYDISIEDKLHTLCHHIAFQISRVISKTFSRVLVTGGGAYHDFLIEQIKNYSQEAKILIPNADIVEYKEALIFGLLGVLRFRNEINVLSSVTGASSDHSSGVIFYPTD